MGDREALLNAILDNPDDDTPKLVFADYLDEHEETQFADLIRVQVELRRHSCIYDNPSWDSNLLHRPGTCSRCDLKRREMELYILIRLRGPQREDILRIASPPW